MITPMVEIWTTMQRRLTERREAAGLTGKEAAELSGVSNSYVSNLENGYNKPGALELIAKLSRIYNTSTDYLLGVVDDPSPNAGAEWPSYGRELMTILDRLPESRRAELVGIAETLAAAEAKRAEENAQIERMVTMLEALLPPEQMDELLGILEASVTTGDIATARRDIAALLAEHKTERHRQE